MFYNIHSIDINLDNTPDQWTTYNQGFIQSRSLNFEAEQKYQIEVKLLGANSLEGLPYRVTSVMGKNELLQYQDGRYSGAVKLADKAVKGNLILELPDGYKVEEVLVKKVS